MELKQLQQNGTDFMPRTVAEGVLVKETEGINTLDRVLPKKIETITAQAGSGIKAIKSGVDVTITHTNFITPNEKISQLKIKYDSNGHIIETTPVQKLIFATPNSRQEYTGDDEMIIKMGDDFKLDNNEVCLTWNNL